MIRRTPGYSASMMGTAITVGTSSIKILGQNLARSWALIVNDSDTDIYLTLGTTAVANTGIRLNAAGGSIVLGPDSDMPWDGAVFAITSASGKVATVVEINRVD